MWEGAAIFSGHSTSEGTIGYSPRVANRINNNRLARVLRLIVYGWMLTAAAVWAAEPVGVMTLTDAQFLLTATESPPGDSVPDWRHRTLPHKWQPEEYGRGLNGWYRLRFSMPTTPAEVCAVYLWRLNMNAAVYFNGQFLGDGGRLTEPVARNWNRPLYFTIPPGLWRAGENVIDVRLRVYPSYAVLAPVLVGPQSILKPQYEWRKFLQNDVSEILFFTSLGVGLFMLALWLRRRRDTLYLWFGLSTLSWSTFSLNMFIRDIPVAAKAWWWLCHLAIDAWIALLALFVLRFIGRCEPRLERALALFVAADAAVLAAVDLETFNTAASVFHIVSIGVTVYLVYRLAAHWRRRGHRQSGLFALGLGFVLLAGVHDWVFQAGILPYSVMLKLWESGFHFMHFSAPVLFLLLAWHLTGRFIVALNESEQLNAELETRIAANRRELEANYRQLHTLERVQAVADERERIYRDLHDDVGAKLLSLVYRADDSANADLARSALQDLRDVVSRTHIDALELEAALADWHAECDQRLTASHIELDWRQADDLPEKTLSPQQLLNIGRILRESVSNAIHHARPGRVSVRVDYLAPQLVIEVCDDGVGRSKGEWRPGRGLRNMELRARELGGAIKWCEYEPKGCCVSCQVPLQ